MVGHQLHAGLGDGRQHLRQAAALDVDVHMHVEVAQADHQGAIVDAAQVRQRIEVEPLQPDADDAVVAHGPQGLEIDGRVDDHRSAQPLVRLQRVDRVVAVCSEQAGRGDDAEFDSAAVQQVEVVLHGEGVGRPCPGGRGIGRGGPPDVGVGVDQRRFGDGHRSAPPRKNCIVVRDYVSVYFEPAAASMRPAPAAPTAGHNNRRRPV